jgi:uncharacterized protein YecE (DUF72 family)
MVGTSGWQYRDWRGRLYPAGLPQRLWLGHYATRFATVEVNNAFYRLPSRATFASWREQAGDGFCFAVKMSRYLTHIKRLADPAEPVARFLDRAQPLGPTLGPVLLQLPPTLTADTDRLRDVLRQFPPAVRVAVEFRHRSWWTGATKAVLEAHNAALAWADRNSRPVSPLWVTADWGYLRLHQGAASPPPRYGATALRSWLDRLTVAFDLNRRSVFVYFNNDPGGAAVTDADSLARRARQRGLPVSSPG